MIAELILPVISYLFGSLCFGYILAKLLKKDNFGKKDLPGLAGSFRQYGPLFGISVGVLDVIKGAVTVFIARSVGMGYPTITLSALAVVAGHNWPLFFRFNGGGGLAPTTGILLFLMPKEFIVALPIAVITGFIYKYTLYSSIKIPITPVSAASGFLFLLLLEWYFRKPSPLILLSILLFLLLSIRAVHLLVIDNRDKKRF